MVFRSSIRIMALDNNPGIRLFRRGRMGERRNAVRRMLVCTVAVLLLGGTAAAQGGKLQPNPLGDNTVCNGDFGTSGTRVETPSDAAKRAHKEENLAFVPHVAGDCEDADFASTNAEALHVHALANPQVGKYINEHFVSAF